MIGTALVFLLMAFLSASYSANEVAGTTTEIGQICLLVFLALTTLTFSLGMMPIDYEHKQTGRDL